MIVHMAKDKYLFHANSAAAAKQLIKKQGAPLILAIGNVPISFVDWLISRDRRSSILPSNFTYRITNDCCPLLAQQIKTKLSSYLSEQQVVARLYKYQHNKV